MEEIMQSNITETTPEPAQQPNGSAKGSINSVVSLITGLLSHGLVLYSLFAPMKVLTGAILGFISALVAVISGGNARRAFKQIGKPNSGMAKFGRFLGFLYIAIVVLVIVLVVVGITLGIAGLANLVSGK
jgi:hypothetical protein